MFSNSPQSALSLSNYKRSNSLESEHVKEDLTDKTWFFDCIPKQNARELLREFGKERCFLIRYSDKGNQYTMLWLTQKNFIEEVEILLVDDWFCFAHDNVRRFGNMQSLVSYLHLECNYIALSNKDLHKQASKSDLRGEMKSWCTAGGAALTTTGYISVNPKINGDRLTSQIC